MKIARTALVACAALLAVAGCDRQPEAGNPAEPDVDTNTARYSQDARTGLCFGGTEYGTGWKFGVATFFNVSCSPEVMKEISQQTKEPYLAGKHARYDIDTRTGICTATAQKSVGWQFGVMGTTQVPCSSEVLSLVNPAKVATYTARFGQ